MKVAALCEAHHVPIAPHCTMSYLGLTASLHVAATVAFFLIHEGYEHQLPEGVSFAGIQPVGGDLQESGGMSIEVSPLGAFSDLIIYLANEEEKELTLMINGMTGLPEFFNGRIVYEDLVASYEPK